MHCCYHNKAKGAPFASDSGGWRGQKATNHPWNIADHIGNHHDVMDVMIIIGRYIDPTPTRECPNDTKDKNYGGQKARRTMQIVLDEYECKARAYFIMV